MPTRVCEDGNIARITGMEKNFPNLIPVPRVRQALIDMKKDGSYQAIYDRYLSVLDKQ